MRGFYIASGFTFIEIILSLFIFSIFFLGIADMQINGLKKTAASNYFLISKLQVESLREILSVIKNKNDDLINEWNKKNKEMLPNGRGIIVKNINTYLVKILWGNLSENNCSHTIYGTSGCLVYSLDT